MGEQQQKTQKEHAEHDQEKKKSRVGKLARAFLENLHRPQACTEKTKQERMPT